MDLSQLNLSAIVPDAVVNWLLVVFSIVLLGCAVFFLRWAYGLRRQTCRVAGYRLARVLVLFGWASVLFQILCVTQGILIAVDRISTVDWRVLIFLSQEVVLFTGLGVCYRELRELE